MPTITGMWMDGPNGYKLKFPTSMGQLVRTMLESGVTRESSPGRVRR